MTKKINTYFCFIASVTYVTLANLKTAWANTGNAVQAHAEDELKHEIGKEVFEDIDATNEHGSGFPQFDTSTYPSQLFWLAVSFIITYLVLSRIALPKIAYVIDLRNAQREGNLAEAEKLNNEAGQALEEYEEVIAKAHDHVRVILQEMKEDITDTQNKHYTSFQEETKVKLNDAEKNLQKSVNKALKDVTIHASGLVEHASKQLGDITVSNTDSTKVVSNLWKKTGETA